MGWLAQIGVAAPCTLVASKNSNSEVNLFQKKSEKREQEVCRLVRFQPKCVQVMQLDAGETLQSLHYTKGI